MTLSQVLFCCVNVIGHDVGDSCSRAISSGSGLRLRYSYRSWHPELSHVSVLQLLEVLVRTLSKLINRCQAPGMGGGLALAAEPS